MTEQSYRLVFKGEILPGRNLEEVKKNLGVMLKLGERRTEVLFSGKRVVLWKRTEALKANKIKSAFKEAGAILRVEPFHSEMPPAIIPSSALEEPGNRKARDLPAIIVFVTALIVFFCLSGYLVWLTMKPDPTEKRAPKHVSRSTKTTEKKSISSRRKKALRRGAIVSEDDLLLLRRLREEGLMHVRKGEYKEAESPYRKRLVIMTEKGGKSYRTMPAAMNDLAYVLREQGRYNEAERLYLEAVKICKDSGKGEDLSVAVASEGLAKIYLKQNKLEKIDPLYLVAIRIWDRLRGPDNGNSLAIKQSRAELLEKLGRQDEAKVLKEYVFKVRKRLLEKRAKGSARAVGNKENLKDIPAKGERIPVSISKDFAPVEMIISAMSGYHPRLRDKPPEDILKEPKYKGKAQKYGRLILGTYDKKTYYFVLDLLNGPHPVLYFDKNGNRNLTDDGPPLKNKGTGFFATTITIPIKKLIKELDSSKNFSIWFYTNETLWPKGITRHYSRTQMRGRVKVNGKFYLAYIAERNANDADFTNDGIYLDLNGNRKIEYKNEYIGNRQIAMIGGKEYWFDVQW